MKVINKNLLAEFRAKLCCEWCHKVGPVDPHHIWAKGMGGSGRLDVRVNLVALCRTCHSSHHSGNEPLKLDLLYLVAEREGCLQRDIEAEIHRLRRLPKGSVYVELDQADSVRAEGNHEGPGANPVRGPVPPERPDDRGAGLEADEARSGWINF